MISAFCDEEVTAMQLSLGLTFPNLFLSGLVWPLEGMPFVLRRMVYFLPQTYAVETINSIFTRGWGIEQPSICIGFIATLVWIFIPLILCLVVLRIRKYTG